MKVRHLGATLLSFLAFYGCDDNTGTLGMGMLPDADGIAVQTTKFDVSTKSILADKVYSKTSMGYIGKFTDPDKKGFGSYEAGFLAELNCTEGFTFPAVYKESADGKSATGTMVKDEVERIQLVVHYRSWFGDSLNACRMSAYELNEDWLQARKAPAEFRYTDINAEDYIDKAMPLGRKAYTAYDTSVPDSVRNETDLNGNPLYSPNIAFTLSKERGNRILELNRKYQKGENNFFDNSEEFINNVFKGVYLKTDYGDGTILYVNRVDLQMQFRFHYVDSVGLKLTKKITDKDGVAGSDSTYLATAVAFATTKEVIQANKFENSDMLTEKVESDSEKGWSYLKSPAGIFTEATLPYDEIAEQLSNDTLNAVKLTFTNYNQDKQSKFSMGVPETVLLVRKKDMNSFFVNNEVADNITSFVATHNSAATNQYTFNNIARLVSTCINEKKSAKQKAKEAAGAAWNETLWEEEWNKEGGEGEGWDKVVLIPVVVSYDTGSQNPSMIGIQHDLKPTYAKLKGGDPAFGGSNLEIEVTYTSFYDNSK